MKLSQFRVTSEEEEASVVDLDSELHSPGQVATGQVFEANLSRRICPGAMVCEKLLP